MSLADQIIEHGPYEPGHAVPAEVESLSSTELNELRDELIELRQRRQADEALERYDIAPGHASAYGRMTCLACYEPWEIRDPLTLAELVRRAAEHGEECR